METTRHDACSLVVNWIRLSGPSVHQQPAMALLGCPLTLSALGARSLISAQGYAVNMFTSSSNCVASTLIHDHTAHQSGLWPTGWSPSFTSPPWTCQVAARLCLTLVNNTGPNPDWLLFPPWLWTCFITAVLPNDSGSQLKPSILRGLVRLSWG